MLSADDASKLTVPLGMYITKDEDVKEVSVKATFVYTVKEQICLCLRPSVFLFFNIFNIATDWLTNG